MTAQTDSRTLTHRIGADGLFVLRVDFGDIRIRGIDGEVATVRAADGQPLDGLEVEPGERSLAIRSRHSADFLGSDFLDFARAAEAAVGLEAWPGTCSSRSRQARPSSSRGRAPMSMSAACTATSAIDRHRATWSLPTSADP